jgi:hypothetical protein
MRLHSLEHLEGENTTEAHCSPEGLVTNGETALWIAKGYGVSHPAILKVAQQH